MPLSHKPLRQMNENDLLALIADSTPEGKTIEYKRDQVGKADTDKREYLFDVTSLANTMGGHLIFGMEEKDGKPVALDGVNIQPDDEILRLEQMARLGVRPPIIGLNTVCVPLSNGRHAVVMRVPKSWSPPHQVTFQKSYRFYARDTNGKYQLDVDELRAIFALSATAAERMKTFRIERIAKIVGGAPPVPIEDGGKMVVHLLPLAAFTGRLAVDLNALWRDHSSVVGVMRGGGSMLFNIDGLMLASSKRPAAGYEQVFRDGCVEVVDCWSAEANNGNYLPVAFEGVIIEDVYRGKQLFEKLGVAPPIVVLVTLVGMNGWRVITGDGVSATRFDRDPIFVPELVLESFDGIVRDETKPILDAVWNAAGDPCSPNYNSEGKRRPGT